MSLLQSLFLRLLTQIVPLFVVVAPPASELPALAQQTLHSVRSDRVSRPVVSDSTPRSITTPAEQRKLLDQIFHSRTDLIPSDGTFVRIERQESWLIIHRRRYCYEDPSEVLLQEIVVGNDPMLQPFMDYAHQHNLELPAESPPARELLLVTDELPEQSNSRLGSLPTMAEFNGLNIEAVRIKLGVTCFPDYGRHRCADEFLAAYHIENCQLDRNGNIRMDVRDLRRDLCVPWYNLNSTAEVRIHFERTTSGYRLDRHSAGNSSSRSQIAVIFERPALHPRPQAEEE